MNYRSQLKLADSAAIINEKWIFMLYTKKAVYTSACISLCVVIPLVFHAIPNAGNIWLPMHIPVLLCGLICGWKFGLLCGIAGPLISSILTQMPAISVLPSMIFELSSYGFISGLLSEKIRTGKSLADIMISQIISMLIGRIIYGIMNSVIFKAGNYSIHVWLSTSFLTALPGIILQIILIPAVIYALEKSSLIPERY